MNCSSCGASIPPGVMYCPSCGVPTPYYTSSSGQGGVSTPYDPTIAASSYGNPPGQQPPPTAYGVPANPYGSSYPPSQPQDPYQAPYGAPPQQNPYAMPANSSMPPSYNYGNPPQGQGYAPGMQPGMLPGIQPGTYGATAVPKRRSKVGLIVGIIAAVLLLSCVGIIVAVVAANNNNNNTTTTTTTNPSGLAVAPAAALIITDPQTSTAVDNNFAPTHVTRSFTTGQTVYVTFNIFSRGSTGCITAKWYDNGQILHAGSFTHDPKNNVGYFSQTYDTPTSGVVELYWSPNLDCSNSQLAQVRRFTVAGTTSMVQPEHADLAQDAADRRAF